MNKRSVLLASAAALVFASNPAVAADKQDNSQKATDGMVKCTGTHSCHGQSDCKGYGNQDGAGKNTCGGQGFKWRTPEECLKAGGKVNS